MSPQIAAVETDSENPSTLGRAALMAALLALLALLPAFLDGSAVHWPDNTDNTMRLVQVRDLLAGQGWFDYMQYRMGLDGGFVMHWSRIVDLPIATIILTVQAISGSAELGELTAGIVWPSLLLAVSILSIVRSARIMGGDEAVLPAALIGLMSLYSIGIFAPGAFDHHNLQLTLCLLALWALLGTSGFRNGIVAGILIALSLATGMETVPLVATAGLCVAMTFLFFGQKQANLAIGFGSGITLGCTAAFVATIEPSNWAYVHCDAYSIAHLVVAAIGGSGLVVIASTPAINKTLALRGTAMAALTLALALIIVTAYPQCLSKPYSGLDAQLQTYWLSGISEAQSVISIWTNDPVSFAKYYATPLAAAAVVVANLLHEGIKRRQLAVAGFLLASIIVSFWQVRGGNFAVSIAAVPLAVWVAQKRVAAASSPGATLAMVFAWVVSLNACWTLAAQALQNATKPAIVGSAQAAAPVNSIQSCSVKSSYSILAGMEPNVVVAVSNIGPALLKFTPHHVLAGPYHRNVDGNAVNLNILMSSEKASREIAEAHGVTLIAHCVNDDETGFLARSAPDGLIAALSRGEPPSWLVAVPGTRGSNLELYSLRLGTRQ